MAVMRVRDLIWLVRCSKLKHLFIALEIAQSCFFGSFSSKLRSLRGETCKFRVADNPPGTRKSSSISACQLARWHEVVIRALRVSDLFPVMFCLMRSGSKVSPKRSSRLTLGQSSSRRQPSKLQESRRMQIATSPKAADSRFPG
jgi:hypothetical protein